MQAHPRVYLDGPSGRITSRLKDTSGTGSGNVNNEPFSAIVGVINGTDPHGNAPNFRNVYQTRNVDSNPHALHRYAGAAFLWLANPSDTQALAIAKWGINHFEEFFPSNDFYCNTGGSQCSNRDNSLEMDYGSFQSVPIMAAYSIIHDQLTPAERQAFADKVLNDNPVTKNGLGGSASDPNAQCVNTSGWAAGKCGFVFLMKHLTYSPVMVPGQESHYTSDYGVNTGAGSYGEASVQNLTLTKLLGYIAAGLALADDDPRGRLLLEQSFNYYYKNYWAYAKSNWTPMNQTGGRYTSYRGAPYVGQIAAMMSNSVVNGPDLTSGNYLKGFLPFFIYTLKPDNPDGKMDMWGDYYGANNDGRDLWSGLSPVYGVYPDDTWAPYAKYFMRHMAGDCTSYCSPWAVDELDGDPNNGWLQWTFEPLVFVPPTAPEADPRTAGLPAQYAFKDTDYAQCVAALGAAGCFSNMVYAGAVSKSNWSATATQVLIQSGFNSADLDHSGRGDWGSYHIYRKGRLLTGNGPDGNAAGHSSQDMVIELGGGDHWKEDAPAHIARWAGANPSGDAQSRYMYLLSDVTDSYDSNMNATRVHRHIVHFKAANTQDYVVSYDDVATSTATQMRAHWWYGGTVTAGAGTVTATLSGSSRLLSSFLSVPGAANQAMMATLASKHYTSCPTSNGTGCNTSTTAGEWFAVHKPSLNTGDVMPALSTPACIGVGGNCAALSIQDANSPKVAVFARQGALLQGVAFTSPASTSPMQILVAGLAAGTYSVVKNGATILSNVSVLDGDNTLYLQSASGVFTITQIGGPPVPPQNGDILLSGTPSSRAISFGQSGQFVLLATASSSTMTTVSFSCGPDLPTYATCQFTSPVLAADGHTATANLTVTVAARVSSVPQRGGSLLAMVLSGAGFGVMGIVFAEGKQRKCWVALGVLVLVCLLGTAGCGGGGSASTASNSANNSTSFSFTVRGTAIVNSTAVQTSPVTLSMTVQ